MNASQGRFMGAVAWSWLLNVSRKDGGKCFNFISGKAGICEVPSFEKCRSVLE